jgi:hypothetical protein
MSTLVEFNIGLLMEGVMRYKLFSPPRRRDAEKTIIVFTRRRRVIQNSAPRRLGGEYVMMNNIGILSIIRASFKTTQLESHYVSKANH